MQYLIRQIMKILLHIFLKKILKLDLYFKMNLFLNINIDNHYSLLQNYYYRSMFNKNLKIRCLDSTYVSGVSIDIVPENTYNMLFATKKIYNCLFIYQFNYTEETSEGIIENETKIAFKIVTDEEYKMYEDMKKSTLFQEEEGLIKRPKKIK